MIYDASLEIRFQLRPNRSGALAAAPPEQSASQLPQITRVLALAIHFEEMIRVGDAKDYADIARLTCLCRERVSQIARLNYLAPDIQVELLYLPTTSSRRFAISETALRKVASLLSWRDQRREWTALKQRHQLG